MRVFYHTTRETGLYTPVSEEAVNPTSQWKGRLIHFLQERCPKISACFSHLFFCCLNVRSAPESTKPQPLTTISQRHTVVIEHETPDGITEYRIVEASEEAQVV